MNEQIRLWPLRLVLALVSGVIGGIMAMLIGHRSAKPVLGPFSVPAATALLISAASFVAATLLAVSPNRKLLQLQNWLGDGIRSLRVDLPRGTWRGGLFLGVLSLVSFVWLAIRSLAAYPEPVDDQLDYLRVAADIRHMGGPTELWKRLWNGSYLEANRHPLYTVALSFCPSFKVAKTFSAYVGGLTLFSLWFGVIRRGDWLVGGIAAVLLATNATFLESSSIVACEMLLTFWVLLAWSAIEQCAGRRKVPTGEQVSSEYPAGSSSMINKPARIDLGVQSGLVGLWLGLAYLTKASGFFLLVGFLTWSLFWSTLRRWSWVGLAIFLVVSSPLVVRNARAFGDPFYSFNTRFLFAESFDQGLQRDFRGTWVESREYLNGHSAGTIMKRAVNGLGWEGFICLRALGPASLGGSRPLVGLVVLLLAATGTIASDRRLVWVTAIWIAMFYFFFAWYVPIAAGDRFVAPLIPIILLFSARGTVMLIASNSPNDAPAATRRVLWAASLWCITMLILSLRATPPPMVGGESLPPRASAAQIGHNPIEDSLRSDGLGALKFQGD